MSDDRTVKKVILGKPAGRRKAIKPKLRWLDCTKTKIKVVRLYWEQSEIDEYQEIKEEST